MGTRLELHNILVGIQGNSNVYFQPPENLKMQYPCIMYSFEGYKNLRASNTVYKQVKQYTVTVVDQNPETTIPDELLKLDYCSLDRTYVADGLNHFVFTIYY